MAPQRTPARSAARDAAVRRRRRGLIVVVLGVLLFGVVAYVLRPSDSGSAAAPISTDSAVDIAAKKAAANAAAGAKAADAVEQRAWAIGQYASAVPSTDGVNGGPSNAGNVVALTFDDGPVKDSWVVLELLKRYKMQATLFVIGQN
ncbi:MAG: polysaccharide deacetylase family protein, partial [Gaiellales bacterium]